MGHVMRQSPGWPSLDDSPAADLYRRYAPVIFSYLRLHVPSYEDAEDLLVEVFLAAFEHASTNPYISAYSAQTGAPLWTSDKGDILYFDVKPTGGVVFVNARHSHTVSINALNSQNGKVHWSYNTGHCSAVNTCPETSGPLTAADGILYILHTTDTNHEELVALDVTTGATRWNRLVKYGFSDFSPTVSNGILYLAEQLPNTLSGNILHTYRVTDGSERWTHQFGMRPMGEDRFSSDAMVIVP